MLSATVCVRFKQAALGSGLAFLILTILLILSSASMHSGADPKLVSLIMILTWASLAVFLVSGIGYLIARFFIKE
jgi:hypothetical protein